MTLPQIIHFGKSVAKTKNLDTIRAINAASYPHMKEKDQKALIKRLSGESGYKAL